MKNQAVTIRRLRGQIDKALATRALAQQRLLEEKSALKESRERLEGMLVAQKALQEVAKQLQEHAHKGIAGLVTKSLFTVFDNPYMLRILFQKKRGKTEAYIVFTRYGEQLDPKDSSGGGVIDVASFALRLACLSLRLPRQRFIVIMDEPFKWVSPEFRKRVRAMLEMLAEELGFQFVIATNIRSIQSGTVIETE